MNSLTIELLRFGGSAGILDPMNNYLVLAGDKMPPGARAINLSHRKLLRYLFELRYPTQESPEVLKEALTVLSREADYLLRLPDDYPAPLHLDLVTSAAELWAFPFEALLLQERFSDSERPVMITRRVRREDPEEDIDWPVQPRILFAYASPEYVAAPPVPVEDHRTALRNALKPWIEPLRIPNFPSAVPDETSVLTILKEASLDDIDATLKKAREEGRPYSHVHLLAHGILIPGEFGSHENQYGLGLTSADKRAVAPSQLAQILSPMEGFPACVTLTVCDGGNQSNSIVPGSLAMSLHESGIPVVIASQFPLTMAGSSILTEHFYTGLLNGEDVRRCVYETRRALKEATDDGALHDWLSLVAYIQLPDGYHNYLDKYVLKRQFASLRTVQGWIDHIVENKISDEASLHRVEQSVNERIDALLSAHDDDRKRTIKGVWEEVTGLLGSAYTRKAELQDFMARVLEDAGYQKASRSSLEQSCQYYRKGHDYNLTAHWNGVQHIALQCVLHGQLDNTAYWHSTRLAAENSTADPGEIWAWGTLAETFLLANHAGQPEMLDQSRSAIQSLISQCTRLGIEYPIESTRRQLTRYLNWWTNQNGFFPGRSDLRDEVKSLLALLDS